VLCCDWSGGCVCLSVACGADAHLRLWWWAVQGYGAAWRVVGYAVDGFRIMASRMMLPSSQLDNCNGRFTLDPSSGMYSESRGRGGVVVCLVRGLSAMRVHDREGRPWGAPPRIWSHLLP
jgi:hypothetical protein